MNSLPLSLAGLSAALFLVAAPLRADPVLQPNDMVAICGDSITEQKIYSAFMEDYFLMCQPASGLRCAQFGWSGEKAGGFSARIANDVLPFKPTVATTCYGMNDGGYAPMSPAGGDAYRHAMTAAVEKLKAGGVRAIVVGSPTCVDAAAFKNPKTTINADEYNQTLDALRGIAQEVALKEGVGFADIYTLMMDVNAKAKAAYGNAYQFISGGGVHPKANGQLVIAYALLKALGCDGAIGTITVDLGAGIATGSPGQKIVSCQNGTVRIESTRYPFCFDGKPDQPDQNDACMLKFFPFNADLNRYLLVVKGLRGSKANVRWGTLAKEFSAADLAKGVNLAAEFVVNPFCDQFHRVHAAVVAQQIEETVLVKYFLHQPPVTKPPLPIGVALPASVADGLDQDKALFQAASALVTPLDHTITIESEL